jgi:hypothetical protein
MKPRILVIRGGAIGDFVLTLPAIKLLRENFPAAHLEILGYRHIVALAENRFYADASRSIEYGALAQFFVPNAELDPELVAYFASFQQVVSYLFDPDLFFETNVRRCGVKNFLVASPKLDDSAHAAHQLARRRCIQTATIARSPKNFSLEQNHRSSPCILAAAARRKTGRWKTGVRSATGCSPVGRNRRCSSSAARPMK